MNTTKGTHIDFPIKRCNREVIAYALITVFWLACVCANQQILAQETDSRSMFDKTQLASVDPEQGIMWHPGGRAWLISGIQRSFGLAELDEPWVSFGATRAGYSFALGAKTIGWDQMRQWVLSSSAQRATSNVRFVLGSEFWMLRLRHPYLNDRALTFKADVQKVIRDDMFATIRVQNVLGAGWQQGGDPIERKLQLHLNGIVHSNLLLRGGIGISDHFPADYQSDVVWNPNNALAIWLGVGTEPSRIQIGFSIDNRGWLAGSAINKITNSSIGWRQHYWMGRVST